MKENLIIELLKENFKEIDEVEKIIAKGSLFEGKYKMNCTCICNSDNIVNENMQQVLIILETIKRKAIEMNIVFNYKIVSSSYQRPKNYKEENVIYDKNNQPKPLTKKKEPLN